MEYRIMRGNSARAGGEKEVEDIMLSPSHDLYGVLNESGWKRILSDTSLRFNEIKAYMENVVYVSPSLYCLSFPSYQNQIPFFDDYEIIDVWVKDDPKTGQPSEVDVFKCIMVGICGYYKVESMAAIPIDDTWREAMDKENKQKDRYERDYFNEGISGPEDLSRYRSVLQLPTALVLPFPVVKGVKAEKCDASSLWFFGSAYYLTISLDAYDHSKYKEYVCMSEEAGEQCEEGTFYCDNCGRTFSQAIGAVVDECDYLCEACAAKHALCDPGRCYSDYELFEKQEPLPDVLEIAEAVIGILCTFYSQGARVEAVEEGGYVHGKIKEALTCKNSET